MKLSSMLVLCGIAAAQEAAHQHPAAAPIPLQPLAQQVRQLEEALNYLGQPLAAAEQKRINEAIGNADEAAAVAQLQAILDPYVLVAVDINPAVVTKLADRGSFQTVGIVTDVESFLRELALDLDVA